MEKKDYSKQEHLSLILEKGHKELSYLVAIDFFIVSIFNIFNFFPRTTTKNNLFKGYKERNNIKSAVQFIA